MENKGFWVVYFLSVFVAGILAQKISSLDLPASWTLQDLKDFYNRLYASRTVHTVPPTNLIEEVWLSLVKYFGDFYMLVAFYIFMNTCYMIGALFFYMCDKFQWLASYRIQSKRYPSDKDYLDCLKNLIQNYILIIFPLIWISYPFFGFLDFKTTLPLPSLWTFTWQFAFCMIVEDVTHYFLHRMLHIPWFYKNIHKVHHQFSTPFGLAASYAHPAEVLILGFATFFGPLLLRTHFFVFYCWVAYRQLDAVGTHCGYDLPNIMNWIPYYGGTLNHDYHHKSFLYNFSSRFLFMDYIFKTYKEPTYKDKDGPIIYSATGLDQLTLSKDQDD